MTGDQGPLNDLLAQAGMYRLLAIGFSYPDSELLSECAALAAELDGQPFLASRDLRPSLGRVAELLGQVTRDQKAIEDLAHKYNDLFARGTACAPYETAYIKHSFSRSRDLADVCGFYRAFGLESSGEQRELPDFVGSELEFMAIVLTRQAYALGQGMEEKAQVCAEAGRQFLAEHLGRWTPAFFLELQRLEAGDLYPALAVLGERFISSQIADWGVEPTWLDSRSLDPDAGDHISCDPPSS